MKLMKKWKSETWLWPGWNINEEISWPSEIMSQPDWLCESFLKWLLRNEKPEEKAWKIEIGEEERLREKKAWAMWREREEKNSEEAEEEEACILPREEITKKEWKEK